MSAIESSTAVVPDAPVRTCIGCRRATAKSQLLRVVAVDGVLTADPAARLPGRGAYVHRDPGCLDKAVSRRAFQRALRLTGAPTGIEGLRATVSTTHHAGA